MNRKTTWNLAALLMVPLCVGCGANQGVIRGQNPKIGTPPQQVAQQHQQALEQKLIQQTSHVYPHSGSSYGHGSPACQVCNGHGSSQCGCGRNGIYPRHRHTYRLDHPDAVYPPRDHKMGVVQYPYYTVKGPDDFFLR